MPSATITRPEAEYSFLQNPTTFVGVIALPEQSRHFGDYLHRHMIRGYTHSTAERFMIRRPRLLLSSSMTHLLLHLAHPQTLLKPQLLGTAHSKKS